MDNVENFLKFLTEKGIILCVENNDPESEQAYGPCFYIKDLVEEFKAQQPNPKGWDKVEC